MTKLAYKLKISKKQAIDKICAHAMFGDLKNQFGFKTQQEVLHYLLQKEDIDSLVERCRNPKMSVPSFENLLGSTWQLDGAGGSVTLVDESFHEVSPSIKGPGEFIWSSYKSHFEMACLSRDRAVYESSFVEFQNCLTQGFASIEAFLNTQVQTWNRNYPEARILEDSRNNKISIEEKLDQWLPKMSNNHKLDKTSRVWTAFQELKQLRDEYAVHPKLAGYGVSFEKLAQNINSFRYGVALLLGNLHTMLNCLVPAVIVNACYAPDVEVIQGPASGGVPAWPAGNVPQFSPFRENSTTSPR